MFLCGWKRFRVRFGSALSQGRCRSTCSSARSTGEHTCIENTLNDGTPTQSRASIDCEAAIDYEPAIPSPANSSVVSTSEKSLLIAENACALGRLLTQLHELKMKRLGSPAVGFMHSVKYTFFFFRTYVLLNADCGKVLHSQQHCKPSLEFQASTTFVYHLSGLGYEVRSFNRRLCKTIRVREVKLAMALLAAVPPVLGLGLQRSREKRQWALCDKLIVCDVDESWWEFDVGPMNKRKFRKGDCCVGGCT